MTEQLPTIDTLAHLTDLSAAVAALGLGDGGRFIARGAPIPNLRVIATRDDAFEHAVPTGAFRATFDETDQLAICHPLYDGFLVTRLSLQCDLAGLEIRPSTSLHTCITPHHTPGPLAAGQDHPIDLELHPGNIPSAGVRGMLHAIDPATDSDVCQPMTIVLASSPAVDCVLAGRVDGPLSPDDFDEVITTLHGDRPRIARIARRISAAEQPTSTWRRWLRR